MSNKDKSSMTFAIDISEAPQNAKLHQATGDVYDIGNMVPRTTSQSMMFSSNTGNPATSYLGDETQPMSGWPCAAEALFRP